MGKIGLKARAEIDMPTPEPTHEGFRVLVVMCAELAVFAGVLGHSVNDVLKQLRCNYSRSILDSIDNSFSIQRVCTLWIV